MRITQQEATAGMGSTKDEGEMLQKAGKASIPGLKWRENVTIM